jgi:ParB family transcriptional regulator, chromosome partitioning protein
MTLIDLKPAATGPDYMRFQRMDIKNGLPWSMDRRPLDEATVALLMESMRLTGLKQPIVVYVSTPGMPPKLVAGRHRLAAAIRLGWTEIDTVELPRTGEDAATLIEMTEIAENLHRREIAALERSELQARWAGLVKVRQSAQLGQIESKRPDGKGHRAPGGLSAAARDLGISRQAAQRSITIAEKLAPEAKAVAREKGLADHQAALLEAARKPTPDAQIAALLARAFCPEKEWIDQKLYSLLRLWGQAPIRTRRAFVERLGLVVPKGVKL